MKNAAGLSRLLLCLGIVAGLFALTAVAYAQRAPATTLGSGPFNYHTSDADFRVVVIKGLVHPWSTAFLPDGSILVTERPGRLRIIRNGVLDPTPISGVPPVYSAGATNGLLDIALDPNFAKNHYVYLSYDKPVSDLGSNYVPIADLVPAAVMGRRGSGKNAMTDAIARGVWNGHALTQVRDIFVDQNVIDDSIGIGQDSAVRIVFGRDGKLYMGTGAGDVPGNPGKYGHTRGGRAQDPSSDGGKILRLNADGTIPRDNPFVGKPGYRPGIYTLGHRNITGMAVNPASGEIWEAENGPQDDDKLIVLKRGANYGWPIVGVGYDYSGDHIGGPIALGDPSAVSPGYLNGDLPGIEQPFLIWVPAMAPSGLAFYTGDQFPKWKGSIFVGSLKYRRLERHVRNDTGGPIRREYLLEDLKQRIRDVRQGPDGDLYVLTDEDQGAMLRIEPVKAAAQ